MLGYYSGMIYLAIGAVFFLLIKYFSDARTSNRKISICYNSFKNDNAPSYNKLTLRPEQIVNAMQMCLRNNESSTGLSNIPPNINQFINALSLQTSAKIIAIEEAFYLLNITYKNIQVYEQSILRLSEKSYSDAARRIVYEEAVTYGNYKFPKDSIDILDINNICCMQDIDVSHLTTTEDHQLTILVFGTDQLRALNKKQQYCYAGNALLLYCIINKFAEVKRC